MRGHVAKHDEGPMDSFRAWARAWLKDARFCLAVLPLFAALPAQAAGLADRAAAAMLAPHRAIYEISLVNAKSGSQLVNVAGRMMYEWRPTCEAWISNHRFDINYEYADTPPMLVSSDFATYEPFDGKSMDFSSRRRKDGNLYEELRGRAETSETGGRAAYTMPGDLAFDLPAGALFPVGHTLAVLDALKTGKKYFRSTIFDGSDDQGPVDVTSFLGASVDESAKYKDNKKIDPALIGGKAWKARLAFFPLKDKDAETSDYEMSLVFHENGIIGDMVIDYNDFTIRQDLVALEPLDDECAAGNAKSEKKGMSIE